MDAHGTATGGAEERVARAFLTERIPTVRPNAAIADIETLLLKNAKKFESINYVYVTDGEGKLLGVISLKETFGVPKSTKVADVMKKDGLVTARPHTHEERIAYLAIEHNLREIPVTDAEGRLLGAVPPNAIFKILHQEHIDSILKFAGVHRFRDPAINITNASAGLLIKKRLPWLIVGLLGSTATAAVVSFFRATLEHQILLAAFIPSVAYIAAAVGIQSETMFVRTLAIDRTFTLKRYLWRELRVGLALASILAFSIAAVSSLIWQNVLVSVTLALSFFTAITVSMTLGILLPWMFSRLRIDPALTSGPFDTALSDLSSIFIYFAVATLVLKLFLNVP